MAAWTSGKKTLLCYRLISEGILGEARGGGKREEKAALRERPSG
jgi:hypothetical protein